MYNPYRIGPDWDFAIKHGKACLPGKVKQEEFKTCTSIEESPTGNKFMRLKAEGFCHCCLNTIHKEPLQLCQNSKQLQFLGFGFPLYFIFTKYAIILLLLQIVSYSALSVYWAINSTYDICFQHAIRTLPGGQVQAVCSSWLIIFMRSQLTVQTQQIILRLSSFVIQLLGLVYIRDMLRKTNDYYDQKTTSLSDYSVIVSNIPKQKGVKRLITEFLKNDFESGSKMSFKPQQMIPLNQLQNFYHLKEEKLKLIKLKQKLLRQSQTSESRQKLQQVSKQIKQYQILIQKQYQAEKQLNKNDQVVCQKVILIMSSQDIKQNLIDGFQIMDPLTLISRFGQGGEEIQITQAPEPKEIMWENINFPRDKKFGRLVLGWSLTVGFLAIVTGVFFGILYGKGKQVEQVLLEIKKNPDDPHAHILQQQALAATILTMLSIIFFNKFLLSTVMHWFTDLQKHSTGGEYQFSFGLKYTLGLFFTTAVMTLLVEGIQFHNIYREQFGVIEQQSIMFFFNSFLVPIIWFINPWHIYHIIKRKLYFGDQHMTQQEANGLMEQSKYSMGKKYAQIIQSVWFTYLYATIIPAGSLLIVMGLGLFYWVDKYNLLRKSSINQNVNSELCIRAVKLLDATLLFRAAGQLIFDNLIRDGVTWESILCVCVGATYLFLPMNQILEKLHDQKFKSQQKLYQDVGYTFIENYMTMHPVMVEEKAQMFEGLSLTFDAFFKTKDLIQSNQNLQVKPILNNTFQQLFQVKPNMIEDSIV